MSQTMTDPTGGMRSAATVTAVDSWLLKKFIHAIGRPPVAFALWDGVDVCASDAEPVGRVLIHDRKTFMHLLLNPNLGFGDGFAAGAIEVEGDIIACLEALLRAMPTGADAGVVARLTGLLPKAHANTPAGSRANIHHHYDIGNDFYSLWLDEELVYTCAYYASEADTLERAQVRKMDHVCRKLRLRPGETVVEAGCGWGALARHMARNYGVKVRAYNISHEQIRYAQERARAEGLDDRVEYIEDDYRNITGEYDVFASVGLLEHVGSENYRTLGAVIDRSLKENGRGLIHSVTRHREQPMGEWIEKRIFPGSYVPSLRQMMDIFEPYAFSVLDVENLRLHYARTLREWLQRFDRIRETIEQMYDARFIRAWRLYLGGCSASFASGDLQLLQVLFARQRCNDVPWTRAYLYQDQ